MDRVTSKELKIDKFALEVQHGVEYVTGHRQMVMRWAAIAAAAVIVVVAVYAYLRYQSGVRQEAFQSAQRIEDATVGAPQNEYTVAYPTQADKDKASDKAWTDLAARFPGSQEGVIAQFYLGGHAADKGNLQEAAKRFQLVIDTGSANYSSLARLALGQIYAAQGKIDDARKQVQFVIDHPTATVSKEQAILALAHILAATNPQAARKLVEPLRASDRSAVSRAALNFLSELPK